MAVTMGLYVIKGRARARFKFRHMQTGERFELLTSGDTAEAEIVETVRVRRMTSRTSATTR